MRQIPLKTIRSRLTEELKDLPFEITSYGHVLAVVSDKGLNNNDKGLNNLSNTPENTPEETQSEQSRHNDECEQLSEKIPDNTRFKQSKATIPTGVTPWVNPLSGSALAPKK